MATCSFAAHNQFATSPSICDYSELDLWLKSAACQTEAEAWRYKRNQHGGHENRKNSE
jgi:hypothetical protein